MVQLGSCYSSREISLPDHDPRSTRSVKGQYDYIRDGAGSGSIDESHLLHIVSDKPVTLIFELDDGKGEQELTIEHDHVLF